MIFEPKHVELYEPQINIFIKVDTRYRLFYKIVFEIHIVDRPSHIQTDINNIQTETIYIVSSLYLLKLQLLVGLGWISGSAGYPVIFNIRSDTGY